jgi:hypothetical protein
MDAKQYFKEQKDAMKDVKSREIDWSDIRCPDCSIISNRDKIIRYCNQLPFGKVRNKSNLGKELGMNPTDRAFRSLSEYCFKSRGRTFFGRKDTIISIKEIPKL